MCKQLFIRVKKMMRWPAYVCTGSKIGKGRGKSRIPRPHTDTIGKLDLGNGHFWGGTVFYVQQNKTIIRHKGQKTTKVKYPYGRVCCRYIIIKYYTSIWNFVFLLVLYNDFLSSNQVIDTPVRILVSCVGKKIAFIKEEWHTIFVFYSLSAAHPPGHYIICSISQSW